MSYIRQLPKEQIDRIWEDGIRVNGEAFHPVGSYEDWEDYQEEDYQTEILPNPISIPIETFFELGIAANRLRAVFTRPLTNAQITSLDRLIRTFQSVELYLLPKTRNENALKKYAATTMQYAIILILSLISIASIVLYWLRKEFPRYKIYMIYGARSGQIVFFISTNVFLLVTLSYACACILIYMITHIIPDGLIAALPLGLYVLIYMLIMFFCLVVVNIKAAPYVFRNKMLIR